jgi:hypothetical protein
MGDAADDLFDAYDDFDLDGDEIDDTKTCDRCEASGLHWSDEGDGWRLMEPTGERHRCLPSIDDFESIE